MSDLREFIVENVRCFQDEQRADIRPVTLLIGENSTGKTSFMGSYRALCQAINYTFQARGNIDFNLEPFQMGAFRDIVRLKRGKSQGSSEFVLGCSVKNRDKHYDILFTFIEKGSEPTISSLCLKFSSKSYLNIKIKSHGESILEIPNLTIKLSDAFDNVGALFVVNLLWSIVEYSYLGHLRESTFRMKVISKMSEQDVRILDAFIQKEFGKESTSKNRRVDLYPKLRQEKSIAPLRSKPRRTYDPITESPTAEGEHIPMLMMRLLRTKDEGWDTLHDDLVEFGRQSGLFSEIKIKSHGKQIHDPFQLQVKVRTGSPQSNIMDVGYGINQILPILVEIIHSSPRTFLLQQPEVHLHPRGQAEFSTFLTRSVSKKKHSFLIETHSDHIVDRVRIAVREGIIKPEDVSILYFEPKNKGGAVTIHNIKVDRQGTPQGAPQGYRNFFMKETDKVLGFK